MVAPLTWTVSFFSVYCLKGVGIRILGINQFFLFRRGLLGIGQPAIGVVELSFLNRKHDERVPRAGIFEIGLREVGGAIGMRMIDADQIETMATGFPVAGEQILGPDVVAGGLRAG